MAELVSRVLRIGGDIATFWCPGCDEAHRIRVEGPHAWGYNGNPDAPTFTPSVLVTRPGTPLRCHSFVTDGHIKFLADCTHPLAGQTVPLPDWPNPEASHA